MAVARRKRAAPRGRGRLNPEQTVALEKALIDAAETEFLKQGYSDTTLDSIAKVAGITRRTLYARYANKAAAFEAVISRLLDAAMAPHQRVARARPGAQDPKALLLQIARELAQLSEATRVANLNRLIFAESRQAPDLARLFLGLHHRAAEEVRTSLEALQKEGKLPRIRDCGLAAVLFVEMAASMPRLRAVLGVPFTDKETNEMTAAAVDIFLNGCG